MNVRIATLLFFLLLPFQFAVSIGESDIALARIGAMALGIWWCVDGLARRQLLIPRGTVATGMALFLCWTIASFFVSDVVAWTARKFAFLVSFAPLFFVLVTLMRRDGATRDDIVRAWVRGGYAIAAVAIAQVGLQYVMPLSALITFWNRLSPFFLGTNFGETVVTYNSWLVHVAHADMMRAVAFFPDPHVFAFYIGMILPFAWMYAITTRRARLVVCAAIVTVAHLLTFSRGAYMGLCGGGIVTMIVLWRTITPRLRVVTIGAFASIVLFFLMPHNIVTQRFVSSFDAGDYSGTHRMALWRDAARFVQEHPVAGSGLGAYAHVVDPTADYRTPIYAHNTYLDIAAETGLVGLAFAMWIIVAMCAVFLRHRTDPLAMSGIIAMSIFCTHALFDTPLFSVHVFPAIMLLAALASSYENAS